MRLLVTCVTAAAVITLTAACDTVTSLTGGTGNTTVPTVAPADGLPVISPDTIVSDGEGQSDKTLAHIADRVYTVTTSDKTARSSGYGIDLTNHRVVLWVLNRADGKALLDEAAREEPGIDLSLVVLAQSQRTWLSMSNALDKVERDHPEFQHVNACVDGSAICVRTDSAHAEEAAKIVQDGIPVKVTVHDRS